MTKIRLARRPEGITVKLSSDSPSIFSHLVWTLKDSIPAYHRTYSPQLKQWIVSADAKDAFDAWLNAAPYVCDAKVEWEAEKTKSAAGERKQTSLLTAHATLHLLPSAPPELIRAAFKCLAQLHHPDKPGGDVRAMQKINEAYRRLAA